MGLMRRPMTILCLCLMMTGGILNLSASESRVASMGGVGLFTLDNSNVAPFPATIMFFDRQILAELRAKNSESTFSGSIHLPMGESATGGIYLNRNLNLPVPSGIVASTINLTHANDFMMGFRIGENNLGLRFTLGFDANERDPVDTLAQPLDESARFIEFAAGLSGNTYDVGAFVNLPTVESKIGRIKNEWNGVGFGGNGRAFVGPETGIQYVPIVAGNYLSSTLELDTVDTDMSFLQAGIGFGLHYQVDDDNLVVVGIEAVSIQESRLKLADGEERITRILTAPGVFLGGETHPTDWLIVRLGAAHVSQQRTSAVEPPDQPKFETISRHSQFNVSAGMGIRLGRFLLDLDINEHFLFEGPDFISGQGGNQTGDFVNRVSMTYNF